MPYTLAHTHTHTHIFYSAGMLHFCCDFCPFTLGTIFQGINGLSGKRLGANKNKPSPKHRVSACKALLCARFRAIAEALPFEALPRDVRTVLECGRTRGDSGAVALSYSELKGLSAAYQRRKMALLGTDNFLDWVTASPTCESFSA